MNPLLSDILHIIAYTTIVLFSHKVYRALYRIIYVYFIAKPKNLKELAGNNAEWAIITGSSDGIGRSYAIELAEKGFNLILISRTLSKLELVRNEIQEKHPDKLIEVIQFDFAKSNYSDYEKLIFPVIDKYSIGVLVNNAGQMHKYPDLYHQFYGGLEPIYDQSVLNVAPIALITAKVLPQMVDRKAGIIINISSASSYFEMERWALYSSTKRFVKHFSTCLQKEYSSKGITIQTVCPMFVSSNMCYYSPGGTVFTPQKFVKSAIKTIGLTSETAGCLFHEIQLIGFAFPDHFVDPFVKQLSIDQKNEYLEKFK